MCLSVRARCSSNIDLSIPIAWLFFSRQINDMKDVDGSSRFGLGPFGWSFFAFLLAERIALHIGFFGVAAERPDFDVVFVDG